MEALQQHPLKYASILIQLVVLWCLIALYNVEQTLGIIHLMPVITIGFVVHSLLPLRWRLPFFIALGAVGIFVLLEFQFALVLAALIALLFGICVLPFSVLNRSLLLGLTAAALAYIWGWHKSLIPGDWKVFPILGAIFMFRASLFLYEQQFVKEPRSLLQRLGYFLMLPNLVFTLFPVVDYKIYNESYYEKEPLDTYQKGVRWMVRGFFHLLLYRIIYYYWLPPYTEVQDLWSFVIFAVTNYLLILRLSGLFHFSVGVLCLFGWNLPPVFDNYFLASGFGDLWKRINTYWRDYVMKIFYYPIFFQIRSIGNTSGMVLTIWIAFAITWLLHSYQWFWLKGSFPLRSVDAVFWGIFGLLVSFNAVYRQRALMNRKKGGEKKGLPGPLINALQIAGMFSFMCVLWSLWTSPTLTAWWEMIGVCGTAELLDWGKLLAGIAFGIGVGSLLLAYFQRPAVQAWVEPDPGGWGSVFWSACTLVPFLLFSQPAVHQQMEGWTSKPIAHLLEQRLNEQDEAMMLTAYYEDILITNNLATPLSDLQNKPTEWLPFAQTPAAKATDDWRKQEIESSVTTTFKGGQLSTNEWGMRDQSYSKQKPEGKVRIGILGGSYVMGSGVNDEEVFDSVVEKDLNRSAFRGRQYELLNFSVPGYHLLHCLDRFDRKAADFDLDAVMLFSHSVDLGRAYKTVNKILEEEERLPFGFMEKILEKWQVDTLQDRRANFGRMEPMVKEMVRGAYEYLAEECRKRNIQPIFVYWPRTRKEATEELEFAMRTVSELGYLIIDLSGAYSDQPVASIQLAEWDQHPNALGHQLIAQKMLEILKTQEDLVQMIESIR
ncbi:MAG: hypothetical protein AAGG75_05625 [Bacteroidota bacterium]